MLPGCTHESCRNLCAKDRGMNVTCYLVDEHGIVVLSTMQHLFPPFFKDRGSPMGQPLYKVIYFLFYFLIKDISSIAIF